jgi:hypothetical protein
LRAALHGKPVGTKGWPLQSNQGMAVVYAVFARP